ncbi:Stk1 family PASTA domain-containing Ser/Thr kinase [Pontibacillus litoralis]|uniref:Serine/threonine-protein kinase PrkC n=1 Tax=Pontibacillus litoralis JSM 072002 TaxID=1385512 RepID=A0A0A5G5X7_9BACI|nr:Stk1 family PASTA domain-containing Ser/Thr kinase [Pontibacillus litoralis]KGX88496.1 serine/threonine protein kinase [Pontibacillus litoralis JSM 072002]
MLRGHVINDRYEIKEMVGGGGMANVYLAIDTILNRHVAIKVLRLEYANDEEFIARFRREAHSATSLSNPNIVNIFDVGEEEHIYYIVMEYVDGMTLKQYIQKHGPLDVKDAVDIAKQITAAISHAHDNDIIHRDIKPQNILINNYKQIKVTDFGIAMALSATSLTQTNSVLGTVHYLSPEQARGGMATKKSDIYSIGIVLFEMLTGRLPFSGQSAVSIAIKHLQSETPSLRRWNEAVPQSVENVVLKATAKDPFHRYEDIYDMVDDLETVLHPDRLHEAKFTVPQGEDEEITRAIPIITDDMYKDHEAQENTIIHHTNASQTVPTKVSKQNEQNHANKKAKKAKKESTSSKKSKRAWKIIVGIIAFLTLVLLAFFVYIKVTMPEEVQVPDVTEMSYEEAYSELSDLKLAVEQEKVHSEEIEEGLVVRTSPDGGNTVREGATVSIYTSLGKEKVEFADYTGEEFSQTKETLEEEGYSVISYEQYSNEPVGQIIGQVQPSPGDEVLPEDTKVIFDVSKGPELITIKKLEGKTLEEAQQYGEEESGISVKDPNYEHSDSVPEGEIIRQAPDPYEEVQPGSEVEVWVSKGPKEKPPVTNSISYTVEIPEESSPPKKKEEDEQQKEDKPKENNEPTDKETEKGQKQKEYVVRIYIEDMNRDIEEISIEERITKTTQYEFDLTIADGQKGQYKIMLDDKVVKEETVPYEEGESE